MCLCVNVYFTAVTEWLPKLQLTSTSDLDNLVLVIEVESVYSAVRTESL